MKDPLESKYNLIVAANMVFFFLVVSFMIYFNPYGFFSFTGSAPETSVKPHHVRILVGLTSLVVISNLILIVNHIRHNVDTGKYKGPF